MTIMGDGMTKLAMMAAVAGAMLLSACSESGSSQPAELEKLKAEEAKWQADYDARNAEGLASHYAADGALASPGSELVTTATARKAALEAMAADPQMKMQFESERADVAASGDLAYTRGKFTMQTTDPANGGIRTDRGNYLTVWKKQSDGSWKAVEDFVTPGPAVIPGAAPTL